MFGLFKRARRRRIKQQPFPDAWCQVLRRNVPYYARFSDEARRELQGHIMVFLDEKEFEGCGGLELTDEIRVTIAAQACMLLMGRETDYYPGIRSILVYPDRYVAPLKEIGPGGLVTEGGQVRAGEAWSNGYVILSWCDVRRGAVDPDDGHNVVFHEFAHALDAETGSVEGAPVLEDRAMYTPWARVLGEEFTRLRHAAAWGQPTLLDKYGAKSPAEFFAVATEVFFERPAELRAHHPELYEQLLGYYRVDPAA